MPWRDVLREGRVPAVDAAELSRVRSRFLTGEPDAFAGRDRALAEAEELVLWFEHDLYDQLQLIQVIASSAAPAGLAQAEAYLGEADCRADARLGATAGERPRGLGCVSRTGPDRARDVRRQEPALPSPGAGSPARRAPVGGPSPAWAGTPRTDAS